MALLAAFVVLIAGVGARAIVGGQIRIETDRALLERGRPDRIAGARVEGRHFDGGPNDGPNIGPVVGPNPDPALVPDGGRGRGPGGPQRFCGGRRGQSVIVVQLISKTGAVIPCSTDFVVPADAKDRSIAAAGKGERLRTIELELDSRTERFRLLTAGAQQGAIQIARELQTEDRVLAGLNERFLFLGLVATSLAAIAGWFMARRMVRPVEELRVATDRIAATQKLDTIATPKGNDEVTSLARSFNSMIGALTTSREQQQRLIVDASHELRTPLTSLRTNIEMANRDRVLPPDQLREVLSAALAEVGELTNLVGELVELSTDRTIDEEPQEVDLLTIAKDVAQRSQRRTGREIKVQVTADSSDAALFQGRARMLERAVGNLVENAIKYAPGSSPVTVLVGDREVSVTDSGPGINEVDLPFVFDRFFRSDSARTAPGSGLGLAIVRQVAERHNGTVFARNNSAGGATVGFRLG